MQNHVERFHPHSFDFYVCLYPYSYNGMQPLNLTDFYVQVDVATEIGAVGIEVFDVSCLYDEGYLDDVLDYIVNIKGLKAILFLEYFNRSYSFPFPKEAWNRSGFPSDEDGVDLYCEYLENVSKIVKNYDNVWYGMVYPFNSSDMWTWRDKVKTSEYRVECQRLVDSIRKWDDKPIYMLVELWDRDPFWLYDLLPLNLDGIDGYGWAGYNVNKDQVDVDLLLRLRDYFDKFSNKKQFVAQFGFRTRGNLTHGYVSNETKKCDLIIEFFNMVYDWDMPICYFGLTDFPPENADYGLVNDEYNLKPSGETVKTG